jgi:hypothetical protein
MLLAKCLRKLPNDCCIYIKTLLQDENFFFTYDTSQVHGISRNIVLINADVIFSYFNNVYNIINTLIILFNPKIEIKMHYSSQSSRTEFESNIFLGKRITRIYNR